MSIHDLLLRGLVVLVVAGSARAENQYAGLSLPPDEIFEAVLNYANDSNFEAIGKSIKHYRSLLHVLSTWCGQDLEQGLSQAAAAHEAPATRRMVLVIISADLALNLDAAAAATDSVARHERLQMAFLDYSLLAPDGAANDPGLAAAARAGFAEMGSSAEKDRLRATTDQLEERISRAVPHCARGGLPP
jgi:hypothetical protein